MKPKGIQGKEMVLAEEGKTSYKILLPAKPTSVETKAAEDLAQWLQQMTAATFEIVHEPAHPSKFISIGNTEALAKSGLESRKGELKLGRDGYVIDQQGDHLFVWGGNPRGVINGVYSLLEEDLDYRWYHRKSASIPKVSNLVFTPVLRSYTPALEIRDPYYWDAARSGTWSLRNKTERIPVKYGGSGGYPPGFFVHTYETLVPREKYFKSHPEYFSLLDGKRRPRQLCLSNPDVLNISIQQVKEVLTKYPHADRIDISPNDGRGYCECKACREYNRKHGNTQAATLLRFVNNIAEAIETEFPDVKVTTLAYLNTIKPPRLKPRKNVIIRVATDRHAWSHCLEPITATTKFQSLMKAWGGRGARMHVWEYTVNFSHYSLPMPNMSVVAQNIRWLTAHNAAGILLQGAYQGPGSARAPLRCWVWAKQLWNPKLDTKSLIHDFTYGYFGPAAEPMQAYYDLLWNMWIKNRDTTMKKVAGGIRYPPTAPFFTPEFAAQATELFKKAEQSTDDPVILKRIRLEKFALLYLKLSRGPGFVKGDDYYKMLDEFGEIAKENKITFLWEARDSNHVQEKITYWKTYWKDLKKANKVKSLIIPIGPECAFNSDPKDEGVANKWFSVDRSDLEWSKIKCGLDGGWDKQGFKNLTGVGWYRIRFQAPESLKQYKYVSLLVGAADEDATFWLNGQKVFEHTCKSTGLTPAQIWNKPFLFPLGKHLRIGRENVLAVRIFNGKGMGGLWKPLYLVGSDVELMPEALLDTMESNK